MDTIVEFKGVSKAYGGLQVLTDVQLSVKKNDFMVIYGLPSSGKTVLLRLLMGLEEPDEGDIFLRGENMRNVPPKVRNIGYVPQDFALYPHKNVFENIAYPLRLMGKPASEIQPAVQHAASMLSIEDLLEKLPTHLSGGQKQRVAVARGIVKETDIYLMDDPLAGLDFKLREKLIDDLKVLQEDIGACFIYTTSDPIESMGLAETIAILHDCRIREIGNPQTLYGNPFHLSTMDILGFPRSNLLAGRLYHKLSEVWCRTAIFEFPMNKIGEGYLREESEEVIVAVRPESIQKASDNAGNGLQADVYLREDLGAEEIIYLNVGGTSLTMLNPSYRNGRYEVGDQIRIGLSAQALFVFEKKSGTRIGRGKENFHVRYQS